MKLGKLSPKHDPRTLKLENYMSASGLPTPPVSYGWSKGVKNWQLFGNDEIGDCTVACIAHQIMSWSHAEGNMYTPAEKDVIEFYSAVTGYNPVTGANDNGAYIIDVLNRFRAVGLSGRKITAYAAVNPKNVQHVKDAIYIFGGCDIGLQLPNSAQQQHIWDVPATGAGKGTVGEPGSWGGHCVYLSDYDENFLRCVSWGQEQLLTWKFFETYCDEAFVEISPDFISNNKAPNGLDIQNLLNDLSKLK